ATNLYIGYLSQDNTVTVGGTNSTLAIGADLFIGTETNDSLYNTLAVLDGADVSIGNNAFLYRGATLKIDSKSQVHVKGDYEQDEYSSLEIGISSNQVAPNLIVDGTAGFTPSYNPENEPVLKIFNEGVGESNVITIVQADAITIDGEEASTASLKYHIHTNLLLGFNITLSNGVDNSFIVLDDFIKYSSGEAGDLEGQLLSISEEIEALHTTESSNMLHIIEGMTSAEEIYTAYDNYFGEKMGSAPMHNVVNQGVGTVASELTGRGDTTRDRMAASAPAGAAGPHAEEQELQGWIAGYGQRGDKSAADGFDAYDSSVNGFIIGADLSVSKGILVGLAGGSSSGSVDKDNGASGDTKTTYLAAYTSMGTKDWFMDGSMIYGSSSIDNKLGDTFDTTAAYDAKNIAFYLGGGKEIIGKYLIITPQASILANYYEQDAYEEESSIVGRSVDGFDTLYLQSSIGGSIALYTTMGELTLKPELRVHWLHEFNGDEESLPYQLIGGTGNYNMLLQAPEEDILKIGAGVSSKLSELLEIRFDLDTRMGSNYSDYTATGSLRYQF
ncbi:MAG: autotransporter outer membrane beta-barrel domain-containing protein, partial [Verrucomicrobiota bacterium]